VLLVGCCSTRCVLYITWVYYFELITALAQDITFILKLLKLFLIRIELAIIIVLYMVTLYILNVWISALLLLLLCLIIAKGRIAQ